MKNRLHAFVLIGIVSLAILACRSDVKTGEDLSRRDRAFIEGLGILDSNETIVLFDSQGGGLHPVQNSGNFIIDRRIASYWIDGRDTTRNHIEYAYYEDVDTILRFPKFKSFTLASYLEVYKINGKNLRFT